MKRLTKKNYPPIGSRRRKDISMQRSVRTLKLCMLKTRLHGHAIFGVVSVSDTCRTPERVRRARFRCPAVSLFFFFSDSPTRLRHGADAAPTRPTCQHLKKKKKKREKTQILTGGLTYSVDFVITLKH